MSEAAQAPPRRSLMRDVVRGTGFYSLALFGPKLASMFLLPLYTRYLTPADYGVMDLLDQAGSVLALFFGSNFSASLFYFYFQRDDAQARNIAAATNILGCALFGLALAVFGTLFAAPINLVFQSTAMVPYFRIMFVTIAISFAFEAIMSWIRAENKPHWYTVVSLTRLALIVTLSLLFLTGFRWGIRGVLLSNLTSVGILTLVLGAWVWRKVGASFSPDLFWQMLRFSIPAIFGGMALFIMHFADRFILERYVSLTQLGQYSVGYKIGMLIAFVHSSFHTYWSSQAYDILKRPDRDVVFGRIFTYMVAGLSFCALGLVAVTKPTLALLTTSQYKEAAVVVPLIVLAYTVRAAGDYFRTLFGVYKRMTLDAICNWTGASVCLVCYFVLIPRYGAWGAALATLITFSVVLVTAHTMASRLMPFRLETMRLAKLAVVGTVLGAGAITLQRFSLPMQIVGALVIVVLYPALLWLTGFFTADDIGRLRQLLAMARQRAMPQSS